ncbi:hypothetical protein B0T14DRAFT_593629 [Immersiella caudata]|uniref:Uncharacterized protein n=1 Tax=Immersiella caudata TaxID=314043 RepID=A0AA39TX64_9PEZI|nr:hypothetical protein B0T14DRAFT_593629 [Immersiella caudata]
MVRKSLGPTGSHVQRVAHSRVRKPISVLGSTQCLFAWLQRKLDDPRGAAIRFMMNFTSESDCLWRHLWFRLNDTRSFLATDPRDRVFALKALLGKHQDGITHLIDYQRSAEDIFVQVAEDLLNSIGLFLLDAIRSPHDRPMPSWTPDWSYIEPPGLSGYIADTPDWALGVDVPRNPQRKYSYCFSLLPLVDSNFPALRVEGWQLGSISIMGACIVSLRDREIYHDVLQPIQQFQKLRRTHDTPTEDANGYFPIRIQRALAHLDITNTLKFLSGGRSLV